MQEAIIINGLLTFYGQKTITVMLSKAFRGKEYGDVAEWFKAHAWKVCWGQLLAGSNPVISAIFL